MSDRPKLIVSFVESRRLDKDELDSDEEELEEEDFEFSVSGLKSVTPELRQVTMRILNLDKPVETVSVKCRLPWTWPWLQATIQLKCKVTKYLSEINQLHNGTFSVIQYHLNQTQGDLGMGICIQFINSLKDKDTDDGLVAGFGSCKDEFGVFLRDLVYENPAEVRLGNLSELLDKFESYNSAAAQLFRQLISSSVAGKVWLLATNQPFFFRAAPILFNKKIISILPSEDDSLEMVRKKKALLDKLEEITQEAPWKMGFSDIMYSETNFSGLEAPYFAMKTAWFFDGLEDIHKSSLLLYDAIKTECRNRGHTFVLQGNMNFWFESYLKSRRRLAKKEEDLEEMPRNSYDALLFLLEHDVLMQEIKGAEERFHLMRFWRAEEGICSHLQDILKEPDWELPVDLEEPQFKRIQEDEDQMRAAGCIRSKPITLISGRGGTGKTEVVSAVLSAAEKMMLCEDASLLTDDLNSSVLTNDNSTDNQTDVITSDEEDADSAAVMWRKHNPDVFKDTENSISKAVEKTTSNGPILYCAPTGKAASVIKKRVGKKAFTIHQVLASWKIYKSGDMLGVWKFAETRIVAVDECSMVSLELFHWLIKYLRSGSMLQKIVLLGDHLQLPSVDPGNFMADLHAALKQKGMVVELKTNHRSEGNLIFNNATKISEQKIPEFDKEAGFSLIIPGSSNLYKLPPLIRKGAFKLDPSTTKPLDTVVPRRGREGLGVERRELYWALLRDNQLRFNIKDDEKSQIISFINRDCESLNQFGCFVYNKHTMYELTKKWKKQFHIRDKVMCTKNADISVYEPEDKSEDEDNIKSCILEEINDGIYKEPNLVLRERKERLMNGSLYKIRAVVKKSVKLQKEEQQELQAEGDDPGANLSSAGSLQEGKRGGGEGGGGEGGGREEEERSMVTEYYVLDDLAGDIVRANKDMLSKKCKLSHAWALSIHKFQGSEADTIVYALSGSPYETWQHVYTAVTRGKKNVVILGSFKELQDAIRRRPPLRQTALKEKVKSLLIKVEKEKREKLMNLDSNMTKSQGNRNKSPILQYIVPRDSNEMLLPSPSKLIARLSMSTSNPITSGEPQNSASNSSIPSRPLLNPRSLIPSVIVTHDCDLNPILVESFDDTDGFNEAISQIPTEIPQEYQMSVEKSPVKRKNESRPLIKTPPKLSRVGLLSGKRIAENSPASYLNQCQTDSPATYTSSRAGPRDRTQDTTNQEMVDYSGVLFEDFDSEEEQIFSQAADSAEAASGSGF